MRIGVFCHNYPPHPGGLEVVAQAIATAEARLHDVLVVTTAWQGLRGLRQENGVQVARLPAIHLAERFDVPYPLPFGPGVSGAMRLSGDREVLHAHGALYATTLMACRLRRRLRARLVLTEHVGFVAYGSPVVNALQRLAWATVGNFVLRRTDVVVVYNERVRRALQTRYPSARVEFIGNGVDTERLRPVSDGDRQRLRAELGLGQDDTLALFVGRNSKKKNLDRVLAMPRPDHRLAVVGGHPDLPPDVLDLGVVPHERLGNYYQACDFFIHAATGEGFPFAVQEAMAHGLPVALLWDPGYAALLDRQAVAAADDFPDLALAVDRLARSREYRDKIGRAGRAWAQTSWSLEAAASRYLDLYSRILSESDSQLRSLRAGLT
jgi:glycosyltransferase EpsD